MQNRFGTRRELLEMTSSAFMCENVVQVKGQLRANWPDISDEEYANKSYFELRVLYLDKFCGCATGIMCEVAGVHWDDGTAYVIEDGKISGEGGRWAAPPEAVLNLFGWSDPTASTEELLKTPTGQQILPPYVNRHGLTGEVLTPVTGLNDRKQVTFEQFAVMFHELAEMEDELA